MLGYPAVITRLLHNYRHLLINDNKIELQVIDYGIEIEFTVVHETYRLSLPSRSRLVGKMRRDSCGLHTKPPPLSLSFSLSLSLSLSITLPLSISLSSLSLYHPFSLPPLSLPHPLSGFRARSLSSSTPSLFLLPSLLPTLALISCLSNYLSLSLTVPQSSYLSIRPPSLPFPPFASLHPPIPLPKKSRRRWHYRNTIHDTP